MADFSSLQIKVNTLKSLVAKDSISPSYLGAILDAFIVQMKSIDMSGMGDTITEAVNRSVEALNKAKAAAEVAANAQTASISASNVANAASTKADAAQSAASIARTNASEALSMAGNALAAVNAVKSLIGQPGGIAPLDGNSQIPARFLPGFVDDVVEFNSMVSGVTVQEAASSSKSTDSGCMVVYDLDNDRFLLAVLSMLRPDASNWNEMLRPLKKVAVPAAVADFPAIETSKYELSDVWVKDEDGLSLNRALFKYYTDWADMGVFGTHDAAGQIPDTGKIYTCTSNNKTYRWSGSELITIGSDLALGHTANTAFPGDEGDHLQVQVEDLYELAGTKADVYDLDVLDKEVESFKETVGIERILIVSTPEDLPLSTARREFFYVESEKCVMFVDDADRGTVPGYLDAETIYRCDNELYRFDGTALVKIGGASEGNCINVTVEYPKNNTTNPYYDLKSAIAVLFGKNRMKLGLQITFAATASSWKLYQYIGASLGEGDFLDESNWLDTAGTSAGTEPVININDLCGEPSAADFYSFESAVDALAKLERDTKVVYRKAGMVITYRVAASKWETLQLVQKVTDFGNRAAWKEFGGGSEVETKDEMRPGGKDAFSTGGAFAFIPTTHEVKQEAGTVEIQFKNADGTHIMEPITFLASTGGGSVSGTVVSIKPEQSAVYGSLNSKISTRVAVRSVTMSGNNEVDNAIVSLELIDRDTNLSVWKETVNKPSSPDLDTPTFEVDFSPFISQAGLRRFNLIATDETGVTGNKFISVTAEDITVNVAGVQVLHVREDAMIAPDMTRATVDLFKFENNQSDKGIEAVVDMLIDGEWVQIHKSVVTDTFTKAVSFNPAALGLSHGAYPVRISGTSLNSGIKGNTVYSAIMIVDPRVLNPLVAVRYDDYTGGKVRLYESVSFDVAVYNPKGGSTVVNTKANDTLISQLLCDNSHTFNVSKQIQGFAEGDSVKLYAKIVNPLGVMGGDTSYEIPLVVSGSVIDAQLKEGALYSFDFSSRSNTEADHSIVDGDFKLSLSGANYTTNGFASYLGQNCLRIAENVRGSVNHMPFASSALESAGMAFQCRFATNNIKDSSALLLECYDPASGAGFYIKGNKVGIYCRNGVQQREERAFSCGEQHTFGVTVEPASVFVERAGVKYSAIRLYMDGELIGHIGYTPGRGDLFNARNITMDGTNGDLYIYYMMAYQTHYEWAQAFKNYLVKLVDTEAMIREFDAENVLASQTAEGTTAMRPSAAALWARGIPYVVLVDSEENFVKFDSGTSTSDNFEQTVYYYDPVRPWRSFKATKCRIRRQGTTSAKRCKKNVRIYLSKASEITPLFPDYTNADALLTYELFKEKKIRVGESTMAVDVTTIKIDYSDAGGANDCGVCDMMNATYRALGPDYMTPAQRFFDGTQDIGDIHLEGLELNHSTANHPVAVFRSTSDTLQNVYFEAKGNWKEDKGEQTALGFMNTPGYNLGCLNYQDEAFTEYYGLKDESLADTLSRFLADSSIDTARCYLLSEYCGNRYKFMRYRDGRWVETTGSMRQTGGKGTNTWHVDGDVLNPITAFELLTYQELDWWRGVDSMDAMMETGSGKISSWVQKLIDKGKVTADVVPLWTYYFECMVDNDDLAIAYATGKKVPFELYRMLRFCDSCDPDKHPSTYADRWRPNIYKFLNVRSHMVYYGATDYNSLYDQQAKNMQPMFFLEDGCSVIGGVYYDAKGVADNCDVEAVPANMLPSRMYFNKVYDADGANGKDNDGGCTGDPECDPAKPTDDATGYANPYAGWNSILWVVLRMVQEVITDDAGGKTDLRTVIAAMRSVEAVVDGRLMKPFSPEGAKYFFLEKRLAIWPKMVSSYDGIRKYVQYTATSDTIYFYALQGLGLTSLPAFIEQRWRIRDGYYQTGAFFSCYLSFRIACGSDARIPFTAAKTGYYGIGNDNTAAVSESVYLEAGQKYEFTKFSHQTGALLYIYQADRMSELDLSQVSIGTSDGNADFSIMLLVVRLLLGSANHVERPTGYVAMSAANFGNLPFLETLDIRRTGLRVADLSGCPRLSKFDARDSALQSFDVARTSPINDIALPGSMTDIRLLGLPNLTYTGINSATGLRVPSLAKVQNLRLESSPRLDARRMLCDTLSGQSSVADRNLAAVRFDGMAMKGDASELFDILERAVAGLDADGVRSAKPFIKTEYSLTTILDEADILSLESSVEGLSIHTVIEAYIELVDAVNAEYYSADPEVDTVTLDNIASHLVYYNGETYEEYLARVAEDNLSIHQIITQ